MTNIRPIFVIAVAIAVMTPVLSLAQGSDAKGGDKASRDIREWTVMLYIGADSPYYEAYDDSGEDVVVPFILGQCERAFSEVEVDSEAVDVNLVALVDRGSANGTFVYDDSDLQNPLEVRPEADTSDPETLGEFVKDSIASYPAEKYLLVGKNGHAWCGICPDQLGEGNTSTPANRTMTIDGMASVLAAVEKESGERIDVVLLDGDNMASLEAAYELRHVTDILVASQQEVPLDGFPYYLFLKHLLEGAAGDAVVEPSRLACTIVEDYVYYYNNTDGKKVLLDHLLSNSQMAVTASAFRTGENGTAIERIVEAFDAALDHMIEGCDGM